MAKHCDPWTILVFALTLILFITPLFLKGFTHDMRLEAGRFPDLSQAGHDEL
jgi:hypothetical protein